jgi:hypothetical protein
MLSPVRFSGVKILELHSRVNGYQHYGFQVGPDIPPGVHYGDSVGKSDTADLLDLIATRGDKGPTQLGNDYATPLNGLLEWASFTRAEKPRVLDLVIRLVKDSFLSCPEQNNLLTAILGVQPLSEGHKQSFWKLLVAQLLQDAPMASQDKTDLIEGIRGEGARVPGENARAGQVLLHNKLKLMELVLANGQVQDVCMVPRGDGREGVLLGVWRKV